MGVTAIVSSIAPVDIEAGGSVVLQAEWSFLSPTDGVGNGIITWTWEPDDSEQQMAEKATDAVKAAAMQHFGVLPDSVLIPVWTRV